MQDFDRPSDRGPAHWSARPFDQGGEVEVSDFLAKTADLKDAAWNSCPCKWAIDGGLEVSDRPGDLAFQSPLY
jgi:hypothetical protein